MVDIDTGEELESGEEGILLVKSPGQMMGYIGFPPLEKGGKGGFDGWYITGDIASVDSDGFITIKDRLSRSLILQQL